jgi:hypothetical protein
MRECPLCKGKKVIPENKVHFGDSQPACCVCPVCRGEGLVEILPTRKTTITIIKPYGIWCAADQPLAEIPSGVGVPCCKN